MAQRASIKDVAEVAGVSYKTVSRVVNGVSSVDPAIRARVERAIEQLHYVPNVIARSLKSGSASTLGVLVDSIDDIFFSAVVSTIEDRAIARGLGVIVGSTRHDAAREREQLLRLTSHGVRGVVLAPVADEHDYFVPYRETVPLVAIDRRLPGFNSVTVDDYAAARLAVTALVDGGHRRIALIGWTPEFATSSRRYEAYADVLSERGIALDASLVPQVAFQASAAADAIDTVLSLSSPPTAVFLSDARHAAVAVERLHELRRTDLAIVSFGDFPLASAIRPSISCIDQDPYEIGAAAFEHLVALIDQPTEPHQEVVLPTVFVPRESHLIAAPSDSRVTA